MLIAAVKELDRRTVDLVTYYGAQVLLRKFSSLNKIENKSRFTIGNLSQFIKDVSQNANVTYGKNFSFVHSEDAFSERSKPLLNYILSIVTEINNALYRYGDKDKETVKNC